MITETAAKKMELDELRSLLKRKRRQFERKEQQQAIDHDTDALVEEILRISDEINTRYKAWDFGS